MRYLLDTNIVIRAFEAMDEALHQRIGACAEGEIVTSAIVYAEVARGLRAGTPPSASSLTAFATQVPVLPFDAGAATAYAHLPFQRARRDRLIAAHALSLDLRLVTDNARDFADVPGLRVENWTVAESAA